MVSFLLDRPCKVWLTREESIMEGTKRHPIHAHYKVGFNRDGKLQAMQVRLCWTAAPTRARPSR